MVYTYINSHENWYVTYLTHWFSVRASCTEILISPRHRSPLLVPLPPWPAPALVLLGCQAQPPAETTKSFWQCLYYSEKRNSFVLTVTLCSDRFTQLFWVKRNRSDSIPQTFQKEIYCSDGFVLICLKRGFTFPNSWFSKRLLRSASPSILWRCLPGC